MAQRFQIASNEISSWKLKKNCFVEMNKYLNLKAITFYNEFQPFGSMAYRFHTKRLRLHVQEKARFEPIRSRRCTWSHNVVGWVQLMCYAFTSNIQSHKQSCGWSRSAFFCLFSDDSLPRLFFCILEAAACVQQNSQHQVQMQPKRQTENLDPISKWALLN